MLEFLVAVGCVLTVLEGVQSLSSVAVGLWRLAMRMAGRSLRPQ